MRNRFIASRSIIIIVTACFTLGYAESVNLTGVVKNTVTQKVIAGANVHLLKFPDITATTAPLPSKR